MLNKLFLAVGLFNIASLYCADEDPKSPVAIGLREQYIMIQEGNEDLSEFAGRVVIWQGGDWRKEAVVKARIEFLQRHSTRLQRVVEEINSGRRSDRYDVKGSCLDAITSNNKEVDQLKTKWECYNVN